ncbi:MAG TPA: tetratricopeptide repeat protein [Kofleriaceae bacterium]|nr:tetratricopeptide repeat protein [Kofleriaceae bacterium]
MPAVTAVAAGCAAMLLAAVAGIGVWVAGGETAPAVSAMAKDAAPGPANAPAGFAILAGQRVISAGLERIEVPAGEAVTASLEDVARFEIHGPGAVELSESTQSDLVIELLRGRLSGTYPGDGHRALTIVTAAFSARIVGTVFAIDAGPGSGRVTVTRGQVVVSAAGSKTAIVVGAGSTWTLRRGLIATADATGDDQAKAAHDDQAKAAREDNAQPTHDGEAVSPARDDQAKADDKDPAARWYARAEAALRSGDHATARRNLTRVVAGARDRALAAAARYDLALLTYREGHYSEARALLSALIARGDTQAFREPASYLRCRTFIESGKAAAAVTCLTDFRRTFPSSPHAAEALAVIIGVVHHDQGCTAAIPLITTYLHSYPRAPFAAEAARRRDLCTP